MDLKNLMDQAKQMQKIVKEKTAEFNKRDFDYTIQQVVIKLKGDKSITNIDFPDEYLKDKKMLTDLVKSAINLSIKNVSKEYKTYMGPLAEIPSNIA